MRHPAAESWHVVTRPASDARGTADLQAGWTGVKQLVVPPRAVLTPAARDRLRDARIAVSYRVTRQTNTSRQRGIAAGARRGGNKVRLDAARRGLAARGKFARATCRRPGWRSVVEELTDAVRKGGKLGLLITGAVDLALCLANRRSGVRAVQGSEPAGVRRAVESVGANLLTARAHGGKSLFQQLKIVREFISPGLRVVRPELGALVLRIPEATN